MSRPIAWLAAVAAGTLVIALVWRGIGGGESSADDPLRGDGSVAGRQDGGSAHSPDTGGERSEARARPPIDLRLTGRVRDRLGTPRAGERVWLLGRGQVHPAVFGAAKSLRSAVADDQGGFELNLGPADEWALSVGRIGECRATSEVRRFGPQDAPAVDVILGGPAHLSVLVEGAPDQFADARPALIEILRKEQPGDRELIPFGAPPPSDPVFGDPPGETPEAGDVWRATAALHLKPGEPAEFSRLSVGDELRIALVVGEERYESELTIVLGVDEDAYARCVLTSGPDGQDLQVSFESGPADDALAAGFHWR